MGKIELTRRKFIIGASTSLIAAPAIVRIASLMPVRPYFDMNRWHHIILHNDGGKVTAYIDGLRVVKGAARWTTNFIPPIEQNGDWLRYDDNTFEALTNGEHVSDVRVTKGDRYGLHSKGT